MAKTSNVLPLGLEVLDRRGLPVPFEHIRMAEALLFASSTPLTLTELATRLPPEADVPAVMSALERLYAPRGVNLRRVDDAYAFRTAADLAPLLAHESVEPKKLSRAAMETLAIIAYHQPVTRAEIEEVRGVSVSKGTIDVLLETGWIRLRGRRRVPGRPVTYGTTPAFLDHFGLEQIADLPGLDELKAAGLLDGRIPAGFTMAPPSDTLLADDEDPIEEGAAEDEGAPRLPLDDEA